MVINGTQIKQNSKFMILNKSNFKLGNIWNKYPNKMNNFETYKTNGDEK